MHSLAVRRGGLSPGTTLVTAPGPGPRLGPDLLELVDPASRCSIRSTTARGSENFSSLSEVGETEAGGAGSVRSGTEGDGDGDGGACAGVGAASCRGDVDGTTAGEEAFDPPDVEAGAAGSTRAAVGVTGTLARPERGSEGRPCAGRPPLRAGPDGWRSVR